VDAIGTPARMLYVLSKIFWVIAQPSTLLLLVCIAGALISLWQSRLDWGRGLLISGVVGLSACALLPVGAWLMGPLEDRFPPLRQMPARVDGMSCWGARSTSKKVRTAACRIERKGGANDRLRGARTPLPHARLVFTGGNPDLLSAGPTEAEVARVLFAGLGLDPHRLVFEAKSRNTRENALFSRRIENPRPGQIWLLVTSAADMPRAVGCFRAVAWPVLAFPVDYHTRHRDMGGVPGLVAGLKEFDWAAHEWIGLVTTDRADGRRRCSPARDRCGNGAQEPV